MHKKLQVQKVDAVRFCFVYRLMHKKALHLFSIESVSPIFSFSTDFWKDRFEIIKKWSWNENLESLRFLFRVLGSASKIWFSSTFQIPAMKLLALTVVWMSLLISGTTSYRRFVQISDIHMVSGSDPS